MADRGGGAGGDGDTKALLPAQTPSFLEKASLEHHKETLRGLITCSFDFSKNELEPSSIGGAGYCDASA